ncbi:hypothetical protein tloyanaT_13440 [Thalassotalea loyana]|uniref:Putative exodeoxyribonuclease 8 PDDEXK-like domain-containing protein n=1 Tax=Thalassotalea loyana TaxID=280483 RepID=A0ABQ6HAD5_9GAMM|nr:PD-(D/E)XK nuclease-like domain-containing protein [Thalassotalea loyana]GLX85092.1 hypothetical protein tloyanaT_13440 [Thalassotalea loyana]
MKLFDVTFMRLSKAPKNIHCMTYQVEANDESVARHKALSCLIEDNLNRKHYKQTPKVEEVKTTASEEVIDVDQELVINEKPSEDKAPETAEEVQGELLPAVETEPTPEEKLAAEISALNDKIKSLLPGEVLVLENVTNEAYHASLGVSCSKLKVLIDECPAAYKAVIDGERERTEKAIFNVGSAAHSVILEPHNFERDFGVMPADLKKPTKAQLQAAKPSEATVELIKRWDAFNAEHGHKTFITDEQFKAVKKMRDAVVSHPFGSRLVANGTPEISYWRRDNQTGLIVKCRLDYQLGDLAVDVKTCQDSSPKAFTRHALQYGYHVQDSFYRFVTGLKEFAFLAVEKQAPCVVTAPLLFDKDARRLGQLQFRKALNTIAECEKTGIWPGHAQGVVTMELPAYESSKLIDLEVELESNNINEVA